MKEQKILKKNILIFISECVVHVGNRSELLMNQNQSRVAYCISYLVTPGHFFQCYVCDSVYKIQTNSLTHC